MENSTFLLRVLKITTVSTLLFYIGFSVIKRFGENEKLFWIPLGLFSANLLILAVLMIKNRDKEIDNRIKKKLLIQLVINLGFVTLVACYL